MTTEATRRRAVLALAERSSGGDEDMTVGELREALAALPADYQVVLAKDAEGNSFSPLKDGAISVGAYVARSLWTGDVSAYGTPDNAICLWPVN